MPKSSCNSVLLKLYTHYLPNRLSPCWSYWIQICIVLSYERITESLEKTVSKDLENQAGPQKIPQHPHEGMGARCRTLSALPSNHLHPQIVKWYEWLCTNRQGQLGTLSFYFWDFGVDFSWQNINSEVKRAKQSNHTGDDSRQLDSVFSVIRVFQDPKTRMRVWQ